MSKLEVSINKGLASAGWHVAAPVVAELAEHIESGYVVIPKADLPEVTRSAHDANVYYAERENICYTSRENARMWVMRDVAVWQFIEKEATAISQRRDELASEFTAVNSYGGQLPYTQKLIDRIIELEAAQ